MCYLTRNARTSQVLPIFSNHAKKDIMKSQHPIAILETGHFKFYLVKDNTIEIPL
jgi:hypothetical protein